MTIGWQFGILRPDPNPYVRGASLTKDILFDAFKMAYECPVTPVSLKLKSKMAEKGV